MELILHIGVEKTGTTSIQRTLFDSSSTLSLQSILIPQSLAAWGQHAKLYTFFKNSDYKDEFYASQLGYEATVLERQKAIDQWKLDFEKEISESTAARCIVSSEFLGSRLLDVHELKELRKYLGSVFSSISVHLYLREQLQAAASAASTALRGNNGIYFSNIFPAPGNQAFKDLGIEEKYDYRMLAERWLLAFNHNELHLHLYNKKHLQDGCVVLDFLGRLQIDTSAISISKPENASLSVSAMALLAAFTRETQLWDHDPTSIDARAYFSSVIDLAFEGSAKWRPSHEDQKKYTEFFRESNEWVRSKFFNDLPALFPVNAQDLSAYSCDEFTFESHDINKVAIAFKLVLEHMYRRRVT